MTIHPMHTEADHTIALKRIEKIFDEPRGSLQEDELEIPGIIAEEYGRRHFPIEAPDPIEAITFAMEQAGPAGTLGSRSGNSQILAGNRNLAISMTRKLYASLNIPADMQIRKTVR